MPLAWPPSAEVDPGAWQSASTFEIWSWSSIAFAVAVVGEVLAVLFVYRVLVRGGSPSSTLLWMVVILATPWLGLVLYYLLPRRLQLRRLRRMQRSEQRLREVRPAGVVPTTEPRAQPGLEVLLRQERALTAGNLVAWLATGEEFFARAAASIAAARQHVHCVVYILRPDETGLRFLRHLCEAARRGATVRLCYDSLGSFGLKASHLAELRAAGGHAVAFLPLLWKRRPFTVNLRNHRKLLVVDGEVGYVGGRNVGDEYRTDRLGRLSCWLDAMLELRGPAVDQLQEIFVQDWCTAADEVLAVTFRPRDDAAGSARVGVVGSGPDSEQPVLWYAIVQAIGEATESIELSSPYLVLPPTLLFALQLAAARGVRVCVHTNGPAVEAAFLYHAQRHHYRRLLDSGIEIYETSQHYNHAKLLVVDARTLIVGSANLDLRSAHLNFEIAAVVVDAPVLCGQVLATLAERRSSFRRITHDHLPGNPLWRAVDGLCGLFSPLL